MSVIVLIVAIGCSDSKRPPVPVVQSNSADRPLVEQPAEQQHGSETMGDIESASDTTLTAKLAAAGIPTKYTAHFEADKLVRIDETRQLDQRRGSYQFYGARLVKYSGAAVGSPQTLELEFDLQGALKSEQANSGTAAATELSAIRERAQLLRSHALAQRSTRAHTTH
jgi:hypothetical protein